MGYFVERPHYIFFQIKIVYIVLESPQVGAIKVHISQTTFKKNQQKTNTILAFNFCHFVLWHIVKACKRDAIFDVYFT